MNQRLTNPFPFSDTNKRYHTFDYFCRHELGGKCVRASLDAGFTCPNKDGTCGTGGCIFCGGGSSGAASPGTVEEQYAAALARCAGKWPTERGIPYLQANTNTYASPQYLRQLYRRCAALPGAVMLAIGTRADCLGEGIPEVLAEISEQIPVLVELGMQSCREDTLRRIGRGCGHGDFVRGYERLRAVGGRIRVGLHLINGLPGETEEDMLASAAEAARLRADEVKLHTLCVLRDTPLAATYAAGECPVMEPERAAEVVCRQLAVLPAQTVIGRIGADAEKERLIAPTWVRRKREFANTVDRMLFEKDLWQGKLAAQTP